MKLIKSINTDVNTPKKKIVKEAARTSLNAGQKRELLNAIISGGPAAGGGKMTKGDFLDGLGMALEDIPGFEDASMSDPAVRKLADVLWQMHLLDKEKAKAKKATKK